MAGPIIGIVMFILFIHAFTVAFLRTFVQDVLNDERWACVTLGVLVCLPGIATAVVLLGFALFMIVAVLVGFFGLVFNLLRGKNEW